MLIPIWSISIGDGGRGGELLDIALVVIAFCRFALSIVDSLELLVVNLMA